MHIHIKLANITYSLITQKNQNNKNQNKKKDGTIASTKYLKINTFMLHASKFQFNNNIGIHRLRNT